MILTFYSIIYHDSIMATDCGLCRKRNSWKYMHASLALKTSMLIETFVEMLRAVL